jgi:DNA-binding response OmpR family regulator
VAELTGVVRTGPLVIDCDNLEVSLGGAVVPLTPVEGRIMATLAQQPGRLYGSSRLVAAIWGETYALEDATHMLRVNLARLRPKLGPARRLVETRRGLGLVLRVEPPTGGHA